MGECHPLCSSCPHPPEGLGALPTKETGEALFGIFLVGGFLWYFTRSSLQRKNPSPLVRSPREEKIWNRAKKIILKNRGYRSFQSFDDADWGAVNRLFHVFQGAHPKGRLPEKYNSSDSTP